MADSGAALLEVLVAAVLVIVLAILAIPLAAQASDALTGRAAAGYLAGALRQARLQAVSANRAAAVVFDQVSPAVWAVRRCSDGNGNGVRRAEIAVGDDACLGPAQSVAGLFPGTALTLASAVPDLDGEVGEDAGVRFGRSAMASCSPVGNCTPGTIYVRSARGQQFAVRVSAAAGRTRVWRFDHGIEGWVAD
jgi:type II secretory pathway pseudopilin PulG